MKKTLVALAALAATASFAQSSVTIYGRLDAGYSNGVATTDNGTATTETKYSGVQSHNSASSMWGLRGVEDLGGGMKAEFILEQDVFLATGVTGVSGAAQHTAAATSNGSFDRTSLIGLTGNFGTVRFGRDYTPTFKLSATLDMNALSRVSTYQLTGPSTLPNLFMYSTPNLNGFVGNLAVQADDRSASGATNSVSKSSMTNLTGTYTNGPLFVGAGLATQTAAAQATASGADLKTETSTIGASYDFGTFKLNAQYARVTTDASTTTQKQQTETNVGVSVPMGNITLMAAYGRNAITSNVNATASDGTGSDYVLGVNYALSKRTNAYVKTGTFNNITGTNVTDAVAGSTLVGTKNTETVIGLRHTF